MMLGFEGVGAEDADAVVDFTEMTIEVVTQKSASFHEVAIMEKSPHWLSQPSNLIVNLILTAPLHQRISHSGVPW
eukprot:m.194273 g.194273  ORF g.194273 m.194273 type:complete len:75 (-) comp32518_c5_seq1:177-401(-)